MKILFIEERAQEYRPLIDQLGYSIDVFTEVPVQPVCDILVASPALAKTALEAGCSPSWIQSTWAGVDPLIPLLRDSDILLTGIKGIFGQLMSEYVFAYLLEDLRDTHHFRVLQAESRWDDRKLPTTLRDKSMVIVGTGSIGQHLASTAKHFGMKTIGINRSRQSVVGFDEISVDLISVAPRADYIVGCLPNTMDTRQIFAASFFEAAANSCIFFNVGRGSSVDETALLNALANNDIRAAVLDVFPQEPLPQQHPFWQTNRLTITPHISAPSFPRDIMDIFIDNLDRYEKGLPLKHQIDVSLGY